MTPTSSETQAEPDDGTMLAGVLAGTRGLIAGVSPADLDRPTPCPKFDVRDLVDHLVSWLRMFDAGFAGRTGSDPSTLLPGPDPAADFGAAAESVLRRWRDGGPEAMVALTGSSATPGPMVYGMMVGEYLVHGWDLAVATGQAVPFTADQADYAHSAMAGMLRPEYRGEAFGGELPVAADAPALDRLVAFTGRDPAWSGSPRY